MTSARFHSLLPAIGLALLATLILASDLLVPRPDENVILWGPWRHDGGAISADTASELIQSGWSPVRVMGDHALLAAPLTGRTQTTPSWVALTLRAKGMLGCLPKA
jgi:hypothetical protein